MSVSIELIHHQEEQPEHRCAWWDFTWTTQGSIHESWLRPTFIVDFTSVSSSYILLCHHCIKLSGSIPGVNTRLSQSNCSQINLYAVWLLTQWTPCPNWILIVCFLYKITNWFTSGPFLPGFALLERAQPAQSGEFRPGSSSRFGKSPHRAQPLVKRQRHVSLPPVQVTEAHLVCMSYFHVSCF